MVGYSQGLGKGGAKRHRKILRDNIQGMSILSLAAPFLLPLTLSLSEQ
jgi:hypothetical protein